MPIKGLTDRRELAFPKIGDIRKGAAKTDERRPGKDLTYFRYVPVEGEEEAAAKFAELYGDEPREIDVMLPFAEVDRNFEAWQEEYTAGALQHRCDGETCVLWRDDAGELHHEPKPCPGGCRPVGRLKVVVYGLRRLAYVVAHTTSKWDIVELTENLEALSRLTGNGVNGIPLVLKRRPRKVSTPSSNGKRARREKWMLSIEADPEWVDAQIAHMKLLSTPGVTDVPALAATVDEVTGELLDDDEIEGEYDDADDWDDDLATENDGDEPEPEAQPEQEPPDDLDAASLDELRAAWRDLWNRSIDAKVKIAAVYGDGDADEFRKAIRAGMATLKTAEGQEQLPL